MAIIGSIERIAFSTDGGETWIDLTAHVAQWPQRVPYRNAEIDPVLLADAQVYSLTDGRQ